MNVLEKECLKNHIISLYLQKKKRHSFISTLTDYIMWRYSFGVRANENNAFFKIILMMNIPYGIYINTDRHNNFIANTQTRYS